MRTDRLPMSSSAMIRDSEGLVWPTTAEAIDMGDNDYPTTIDESGNEVLEMPADQITANPHEHEAVAQGDHEMTHRGYTMDAQGNKVEDDERPLEPTTSSSMPLCRWAKRPSRVGLRLRISCSTWPRTLSSRRANLKGSPDYDTPDASVPDATTIDQ